MKVTETARILRPPAARATKTAVAAAVASARAATSSVTITSNATTHTLLATPTASSSSFLSYPSQRTGQHHHYCQNQYRFFSEVKRWNDNTPLSIAEILGLRGTDEVEVMQRSPQLLRAAFKRRARLLRPHESAEDRKRLEQLVEAYSLMKNETVKHRYLDHPCSSNDVQLGVLHDGSRVVGNAADPEHINLDAYLSEEALDNGSRSPRGGDVASSSGLLSSSSSSGSASFSPTQQHVDVASGTTRAFQGASSAAMADVTLGGGRVRREQEEGGGGGGVNAGTAPPPRPGEVLQPVDGRNVHFVLKLSFDEGTNGCTKTIAYERNRRCVVCRGSGRDGVHHVRCPQCHGRGQIRLPSGTYSLSEMCEYCRGHGRVPPSLCPACGGHCVRYSVMEYFTLTVPPASTSMTELKVRNQGHHGVRGGKSGALVVSLLISEHRLFRAIGLDLHTVLPVPLSMALLGGVVPVPTLRGRRPLRIPPCTESGDVVTLEGYGIRVDYGNDAAAAAGRGHGHGGGGNPEEEGTATTTTKVGHIRYHIVTVIPSGDELTGRQRAALRSFDKNDNDDTSSSSSSSSSGSDRDRAGDETTEAAAAEDDFDKNINTTANNTVSSNYNSNNNGTLTFNKGRRSVAHSQRQGGPSVNNRNSADGGGGSSALFHSSPSSSSSSSSSSRLSHAHGIQDPSDPRTPVSESLAGGSRTTPGSSSSSSPVEACSLEYLCEVRQKYKSWLPS